VADRRRWPFRLTRGARDGAQNNQNYLALNSTQQTSCSATGSVPSDTYRPPPTAMGSSHSAGLPSPISIGEMEPTRRKISPMPLL
jgi:hypothetical protein